MKKGTVILIGGVWVALAGQSAHALASGVPISACGAMGGISLGMTCPCDGDMDGSGFVQIQDIIFVIDCVNGIEPEPPQTCDAADIDCDGLVDLCDASRVWCQFVGMTDCCANTACGACCNSGDIFDPCVEVSEAFCYSVFFTAGDYLGNGVVCDPWPCDAVECTTNNDCDDTNSCTADACVEGDCVYENLPNGTACPDELFCNGDETCYSGACQSGPPRSCDDAIACTVDTCNEAEDTCEHTPAECNNDGVCDGPCETAENCPADCDECPCVLDQDGSGLVNFVDVVNVIDCAEGETPTPPLTCDYADLNCDGEVDYCDVSRVVCAFLNHPDCCEAGFVCGACCNSGGNFDPCLVISEAFCYSGLIEEGDYLGDGTVCDPWPCDAVECTTNADCGDENACTVDVCIAGDCVHENVPNGTACPDDLFCNGDETCYSGACQSAPPRTCDDALACTVDTCNEAEDTCVHTPAECNNDGVCDSPCENVDNCPADCDVCPCVLDQDGSGLVNFVDVVNVIECAEGETPIPPLTCDYADLDCDGVVDYCDVSRVVCGFLNHPDCCAAEFFCGACCNSGGNFDPCLVISEEFCYSGLIEEGDYLGDGTVCDPWPCDAVECTTDADCGDENACTVDVCIAGDCVHENVPNGTACPDDLFCNGDETCYSGACQSGPPRSCDDLNPCTIDTCNEAEDTCMHAPIECNHDGVCDAPCENADNCMDDCSTCTAIRDLSDGSMAYCPEVPKTVHIMLDVPSEAIAGAVEDVPPTGWTQISNISDGGEYDSENHKVKWGPFFAPFPGELTYDVLPPAEAVGMMCFTGAAAFDDGPDEPICGDECIEDSCCPDLPADEPQPVCEGCSDDCSAVDGDGRVELCEVIRYACAWKRGCNDNLTGVTGGAYIWMVGECYCWDEGGMSWVPEPCGQSPSGCCEGGEQGQVSSATRAAGTATVTFDSIRRGHVDKTRAFEISVSINPPAGTSAAAMDLRIPKGWTVRVASDGGEWDRLHGKVKWGPFFGDASRTVTATVYRTLRNVKERGFSGTVSFDGRNYPITIE